MDKSKYNGIIKDLCRSIDRDGRFSDIRNKGYSIERMAPCYDKHYYKCSFSLSNGQEITFRIYNGDTDTIKDIIHTVAGNFNDLLSICSSKIRFERRALRQGPYAYETTSPDGEVTNNWCCFMNYFNEKESLTLNREFLSQQNNNDYMYKLASSPKVRMNYSRIYFRHLKNGSCEMLYNYGFSPEMMKLWEKSSECNSLHYILQYGEKYLETAAGFFVIPLKPITGKGQLNKTINTISQFVLKNQQINRKYPGHLYYPDFTYKIYPRELKLKGRPAQTANAGTPIDLTVGEKVNHKYFGDGVVKQILEESRRLVVDFENYGEKTLAFDLAPLVRNSQYTPQAVI